VTHEGCDHIFFVGFLGAGKSTLARNLGKLYRRAYVDTDRMAERLMCKSVVECFEQDGEEAFRDAETKEVFVIGHSVQVFMDKVTHQLVLYCPKFYEEWKQRWEVNI
jgi:adenylate kinase family enzyme